MTAKSSDAVDLALPLKVGVGEVKITPPLGTNLIGYYFDRLADGVHDDLYAKALWLDDGSTQTAIVSCDLVWTPSDMTARVRQLIEERSGLSGEHVMICATHTHTGPDVKDEYESTLAGWIADAVELARQSACPARVGVARGHEDGVSFNRRYIMKDGSVVTNPGKLNPDIVRPASPIDPEVICVTFEDAKKTPVAMMVNFALHCDTIGGCTVSAGWPHFMTEEIRERLGSELPILFLNGAAGDINHFDVTTAGELKGFEGAEHIGITVGRAALSAMKMVSFLDDPKVSVCRKVIELKTGKLTPHELKEAEELLNTSAPTDVDFTLDRVDAQRKVAISKIKGGKISAEVQVISIGDVALVGLPGEVFVELGLSLKENSSGVTVVIVGLANGSIGYIPTENAYSEGGYECVSTPLAPGSGEELVATAQAILSEIKT